MYNERVPREGEASLIVYDGCITDGCQQPTDEYLEYIKGYNPLTYSTKSFLDTLKEAWTYGDWGYSLEGNKLVLATGGWSGNENIVSAINGSMFGFFNWQSSHRGGRHEYLLSEDHLDSQRGEYDKE